MEIHLEKSMAEAREPQKAAPSQGFPMTVSCLENWTAEARELQKAALSSESC